MRVSGGNWECITYIDGLIEYREDHNGQQQSISHIMDDSKRIASFRNGFDFGDSTPAVKYNMDDHLGSSNLSVDENGTLVNREEYYPYGEMRSIRERHKKMNNLVSQTSFGSYSKKRYRFCGKEKDEESGLYYYGARYYSSWTCRFISVDPLAGKYAHLTPYNNAGNKVINYIDIDGMQGSGESKTPEGGGGQEITKNIVLKEVVIHGTKTPITGPITPDQPLVLHTGDATNVVVNTVFQKPATETEQMNMYWRNKLGSEAFALVTTQAGKCQATIANGNPYGYNDDFLNAKRNEANFKYQLAQWRKQGQALQPFLNGGGDMGMGVTDGVIEGGKIMASDATLKYVLVGGVKVLSLLKPTSKVINNPIPKTLARIVPVNINPSTLGAPGEVDVFVTASEDIAGLNAYEIAKRLTIPPNPNGFKVIEFKTPDFGIASPINRLNPGFIGFGRTAGGAREFVIPNQSIPIKSTIKTVQ